MKYKSINEIRESLFTDKPLLNENTLISKIVIENELNEARIGKFNIKKHELEIHIFNENGGRVPHFHICERNGKKENLVCMIELTRNYYKRDKDDPNISLNTAERKALYQKMNSKIADGTLFYHLCCSAWNKVNPNAVINDVENLKCPDYREIYEK